VYRAWESARPDALFRDPFAERLAGERGEAIAKLMPRQPRSGWPLLSRSGATAPITPISAAIRPVSRSEPETSGQRAMVGGGSAKKP
jgi:O-methyltransferase involved in polyketide biosynthesis